MVLHRWVVSFICSFILPGQPPLSRNKQLEPSSSCVSFSKLKECSSSLSSPSSSSSSAVEEGTMSALCCVCLSRLREGIHVLPCRHEFHKTCIERWFIGRIRTCPICRLRMEDEVAAEGSCGVGEDDGLTEEMIIWFSSFHAAGF